MEEASAELLRVLGHEDSPSEGEVVALDSLNEGDAVTFDVVEGPKGPAAENLQLSGVEIQPLQIVVDPGDATADDLAEFYAALSDLYRAYGGEGILFVLGGTEIEVVEGAV